MYNLIKYICITVLFDCEKKKYFHVLLNLYFSDNILSATTVVLFWSIRMVDFVVAFDHLNILTVKNDQYHSLTKIFKMLISSESSNIMHEYDFSSKLISLFWCWKILGTHPFYPHWVHICLYYYLVLNSFSKQFSK